MSAELKFVLVLLALAAASAPVAVGVIEWQDVRQARTNAEAMTGGSVDAGKQAIRRRGCESCHAIEAARSEQGKVGPPLVGIASRAQIAGILPNQPDQMIRWIREPQHVLPGNGMPDQGIGTREARDIAAYLYTLRKAS